MLYILGVWVWVFLESEVLRVEIPQLTYQNLKNIVWDYTVFVGS